MRVSRRFLVAGIAGLLLAGGSTVPAVAATDSQPKLVDRVPTPRLDWYSCTDWAECTTVDLPLDYSRPNGPTTEIAVARVKARDQAHKVGTLFVNPGGPGVPGTDMAIGSPYWLSPAVLDKFDVVGFDPRGLAYSDEVKCFKSPREQTEKLAGMNVFFPWTAEETDAYVASARSLGKACSTVGKPLSGSMSTTEVVRDMEVLRRAVGDSKLNYLGFSYGTAIGQFYANMFPDRFRSVVVDGVINPVNWVGDAKDTGTTLDDRIRSADGAYKALAEIFKRCDAAGAELCPQAGHFSTEFATVADRLRAHPLELEDEAGKYLFRYSDFIGRALNLLYGYGWDPIGSMTDDLLTMTDPGSGQEQRKAATARMIERIKNAKKPGRDFPYTNGAEMNNAVICTDGAGHPADAAAWATLTAKADERAPYFGRAWGWGDAACASDTWTIQDEDAYRGPFNKPTTSPVLVVGNYWDPATNYDDAVGSSRLLPNSRLLTNDTWGHTAYGTSACATDAIDQYLLTGALPAEGTVCTGDVQPYVPQAAAKKANVVRTARVPATRDEIAKLPKPSVPTMLPPVVAIR